MPSPNFDGRRFRPVRNAAAGQVNAETVFNYHQSADVLTATYKGGGVRASSMLGAVASSGDLRFCYQHLTDAGELRAGICESRLEILADGRYRLHESWRWTVGGDGATGESIVEEIE